VTSKDEINEGEIRRINVVPVLIPLILIGMFNWKNVAVVSNLVVKVISLI
jgi:hypothetical protein